MVVAPEVQQAGDGALLLPVGVRRLRNHHSTRNAQYCLTRVTSSRPGECEADIDVLDQSGTVLLTVEGYGWPAARRNANTPTGCSTSGC